MDGEWGYCRYCAFEVTVEDGKLGLHLRFLDGVTSDRVECPGSGREPTEQPGPEAKAVRLVKLTKSWQTLAQKARAREELNAARARAIREGLNPNPRPRLEGDDDGDEDCSD